MRPWLIGHTQEHVRCPKCHEACDFLGPTIEIPPKHDVAAWDRLREQVTRFRVAVAEERFKQSVRDRHDLELRIAELENRPSNPGRNKLLKRLRRRLVGDAK
jgi:hypothetical protein